MATTTTSNLKKTKDTVLNDLHDLQDLDAIKSQARQSAKDLKAFASRVNDLAHDFLSVANDEFSEAKTTVKNKIKDEPLKAAAIAFAVGYLFKSLRG